MSRMISDEELELVKGGTLVEGWDSVMVQMMKMYKTKYGEDGKQKIKDLMIVSVNDSTSPVTQEDLKNIYSFIDDNCDIV
ncbi:MAG: hypothetical protein IJI46_04335 [Erysipelotrichaceae bacterium]|nr:hypothetical protein [Erysipelotrichaceae bacterium]